MEVATVSSKGQIAIPRQVRETLDLTEGSKLTLEIRGSEIVLSKGAAWKRLQRAGGDLMRAFATFRFREQEREREDSRP